MPKEARRKARKPKNTKGQAPPARKSTRRNYSPETRAFLVGALTYGQTSYYKLAEDCGIPRNSIWQIHNRVKRRAEEQGLPLHTASLYQDDAEPWKNQLKLSKEQKDLLVHAATKDRESRYMQPETAIQSGICEQVGIPPISVDTFKDIMYEYGYGRLKAGWKFTISDANKKMRLEWALQHNPDPLDGRPGFNWLLVVFTDETPAKVGVKRGRYLCWAKQEEKYHPDVKQEKTTKYSEMQFWASFTWNHKGPCHMFRKETEQQKVNAAMDIENRNQQRTQRHVTRQYAHRALRQLGESEVNANGRSIRLQERGLLKLDLERPLIRGDRTRGGVDGYRHEQEVLIPKLQPFVDDLNRQPYLHGNEHYWVLEDGAPSHRSRFSKEFYMRTGLYKLLWPSHSPDVNAAEHAWPWIRQQVSHQFQPSTTEEEATRQWVTAWEEHTPIAVINRWIMRIPQKVRKIIQYEGDNCFHG